MQHILFGSDINQLKVAILIKEAALQQSGILAYYINPLVSKGIAACNILAVSLQYQANKCSAACAKDYISGLLPALDKLNINTLLCADSIYFKYLTKSAKAEPFYGMIVPCAIKGYEHMKVIFSVNFQAIEYNPAAKSKLILSLNTLATYLSGSHITLGSNIIHSESYPRTLEEIKSALNSLLIHRELTCDIEGLSLDFWTCGISTVTFCWNQHEGIAFPIDRGDCPTEARTLLKDFLIGYLGKLTYHNAGFDIKVLVYTLWMENLADYHGMLDGIDLLTKNFDDTKLIVYLATNNAVKNELGLKVLAQEYAGNYAEDVKDTSKVPINRLLKYNLMDGLSTWYVKNKYYPIMVQDQQEALYIEHFKPSVKTLLQTELCGMPIDPIKVQEAKVKLVNIVNQHNDFFNKNPIIKDFHHGQLVQLCNDKTSAAKKKIYDLNDPIIARIEFNPGSDTQLRALIYDYLGYAIIDLTDGKLPATGKNTLEKLKANSKHQDHTDIFDNLIGLSTADKILTSFIPAFERAQQLPDGSWRLYGNFNLGGTQSLRLSSCLIGTSMVQCSSGLQMIKDVKPGTLVPTHTGALKQVLNVFDNGMQSVYRVILENNREITLTSNHRLLTTNGFRSIEDIYHAHATTVEGKENRSISQILRQRLTLLYKGVSRTIWHYTKGNSTLNSRMGASTVYSTEENRSCRTREGVPRNTFNSESCSNVPGCGEFANSGRHTESDQYIAKSHSSDYYRESHTRANPKTKCSSLQQIQNSREEPNVGSVWETTSQFQGCNTRRQRLSDRVKARLVHWETRIKAYFSTSLSSMQGIGFNRNAPRICCASRRWRQNSQCTGQLSSVDKRGTSKVTFEESAIKQIDYVGVERVYNLEIETDHCYIANGIYVHNSNPNLQNLPSNSVFAKLVKTCFVSTKNWIFLGSDFDSLEDKVNTLITKDPNKIKVYVDGYDGHCLRAQAYFNDQMPDIILPEDTDRCFKLKIDGQDLYCKSGDFIVDSQHNKIPVEEYYETHRRL